MMTALMENRALLIFPLSDSSYLVDFVSIDDCIKHHVNTFTHDSKVIFIPLPIHSTRADHLLMVDVILDNFEAGSLQPEAMEIDIMP